MMASAVLWACLAIVALFSSGYLFGLYVHRATREALRDELSKALSHSAALEERRAGVASVEARLDWIVESLQRGFAPDDNLAGKLRTEIEAMLRGAQRSEKLHADLTRQLRPLLEQGQVTAALLSLDSTLSASGDLREALTLIADLAGFSTVVLSDNVGLPIASNTDAKDIELHSALSSLFLTLIDRVRGNNLPAPIAAVFRDQANQVVVHRVFSVRSERYVMTAVATGKPLAPDALDPALTPVERIIDRARW